MSPTLSPTIHLIDDDAAVRESLALLIGTVGLRVTTWADPQAFLSGFDREAIGAIVLDVRMPGMSGLALFDRLIERIGVERQAAGVHATRRQQQSLAWMWDLIHARLLNDFRQHPAVREALPAALADVGQARVAPSAAARSLLNLFRPSSPSGSSIDPETPPPAQG